MFSGPGEACWSDPLVARDPSAGRGIRLDETGLVPASVLRGGTPGTTLPPAPTEGQQTLLTDSLTAPTYAWLLQWSAKAAKWLFVGGSSAFAEVTTSETTASATYAALATAGPSFTVPRAGDYIVRIGMEVNVGVASNLAMSYDIGGTGAVDADGVLITIGAAGYFFSTSRTRKKTSLAASTALVAKYKTSAGTATYRSRWLEVLPVALT
jgi:hypothetical protein